MTLPSRRRESLGAALAALLVVLGHSVARAQGAYSPVGADLLLAGRPEQGVLVLRSGYANSPLVDADAMVFFGADASGTAGDVLTISVGVREPNGWGRARLGRFMLSTGAVRPVQIDGVSVLGRTPAGSTLELFGGLPVVPEFGERSFDWLAGARLGQALWKDRLGVGVSYVQRRDDGQLADQELGADASAFVLPWLTLNALGSFDLVYDGLAEARVSALAHDASAQLELFASRRVAARLLPATSLFSIISDAPSSELGGDLSWTAFPRLDVGGAVALETLDDDYGYRAALRSTLRLDDRGEAALSAEATRRAIGEDGYTSGLVGSRVLIMRRVHASGSLELVAADHPRDGGTLWPWTRLGASYAITDHWTVAAAVGGKATPDVRGEIYGLMRVSYYERVAP
jgi:hypothetical protein